MLISMNPKTGIDLFGYRDRWHNIDNLNLMDELIEEGYVIDLRKNNGKHKYFLSKKGAEFLSDNGLLEMEIVSSGEDEYASEQ